jgi:hypothetical protein
VYAGDYKIKARENVVGIIERAIGQDVGLNAFENAEALAIALIEPLDLRVLCCNLFYRQATSISADFE